tara:strand:+ start:1651 stop:2784 length:1134 start_codon:yes stop_codon:yes gene_type:complete
MRQGTLSRNVNGFIRDSDNLRPKLTSYFTKEKELDKILGTRDLDLYGALIGGARKALSERDLGDAGRVSAQEVAQSLAFGETPTGKSMMAGGSIYYQGGVSARKKSLKNLTSAGIAGFLSKSAYNRTRDAIKKLEPTVRGDAPSGSDDRSRMMDLQSEDAREGIELAEMGSMLFHQPKVLQALHREVKKQLRGEAQEAIWDAIIADPNLLLRSGGVDQTGLADAVLRLSGREMARQVAGRTFRDKVLPAMQRALKDSRVGDELRRMREVRQLVQQESRRRASAQRVAKAFLKQAGEAMGKESSTAGVNRDIQRMKQQLIRQVKRNGMYENFGERERFKLENKYTEHRHMRDGVWDAIQAFANWAEWYTPPRKASDGA